MDPERILTESREIYREYVKRHALGTLNLDELKRDMKERFPYISNYEAIVRISMSNNYDYDRLKFMVNMADRVKKNEITEHNASVEVGQLLVDQIVKPQLKKK